MIRLNSNYLSQHISYIDFFCNKSSKKKSKKWENKWAEEDINYIFVSLIKIKSLLLGFFFKNNGFFIGYFFLFSHNSKV